LKKIEDKIHKLLITNNDWSSKLIKILVKSLKFIVPVIPYINEQPNKKSAEANDPKIKYFKLASVENTEFFLKTT